MIKNPGPTALTVGKSDALIALYLFGLALLLCLPLLLWNENLPNDTARYYTPMIREFGEGNYGRAFFPLFPPLFIIVGGLFAKLGFAPFSAAKLASALFFVLTVWPVFGLGKMIWGRRTAIWMVVLFLFCDQTLEYSGTGLLDTGKIFFLTLTVYGLIGAWRTWQWTSLWTVACGTSGMALIRGEGIFFSLLALLVLIILGVCHRRTWFKKLRVLPVLLVFGMTLSPWLMYEWKTTGYPVTDSRQITSIISLLQTLGLHRDPREFTNPENSPNDSTHSKDLGTPIPAQGQNLTELAISVGKGFYAPYAILALIGIGMRVKRRLWQPEEWFLLGAILCHTAFFIIVLHVLISAIVSKRYIIAVLPLLLGWTETGLRGLVEFIRQRFDYARNTRWCISLFAVLGIILLWDGYNELHHSGDNRLANEIKRDCGHWLSTEGRRYLPKDAQPLASTSNNYHNGRLPVLLTANLQVAFWAEADNVTLRKNSLYSLSDVMTMCQTNSVHFVVWDRMLVDRCPELANLENLPASFAVVYDKWRQEKYATVLLAYLPNTQQHPL